MLAALLLSLFSACAGAPIAPPPAPQPTGVVPAAAANDAEIALPALLLAERNAAAARDLATLETLWAEEGSVHETRGTETVADDYHWQGRHAVLNRYAVAVFANPPAPLEAAPEISFTGAGDTVTAVNGVDTWRFIRRDGRWWILDLVIAP